LTYSILITTKNRIKDLEFTLLQCNNLIARNDVEVIVCDDGSTDGTYDFVQSNFPKVTLIHNAKSKGLIYSRNRLLEINKAEYAISLDDDAHFLSENTLEIISSYFKTHPECGVQGFRIFWGKEAPNNTLTSQEPQRVKGFVGCGHVWRMAAWRDIPNYPDWFVFYGEEEFAAFQLFKAGWQVHYNPKILVHHRVQVADRKHHQDYTLRLRRSLRAGWYLYFLFYPAKLIPRKFGYTLWIQLKLKVFKGDFKALKGIILAIIDVIISLPRLVKDRKSLSTKRYYNYMSLPDTVIYWNP